MRPYYSAARFVVRGLCRGVLGWEVRGAHHVPRSGGVLVASNHISYLDPPVIGAALTRELCFLTRDDFFRVPLFGSLIRSFGALPIRRGAMDLSGLARAMDRLREGRALLVFPEGGRMRDGRLHPGRPGVGMMAVLTGVPIVPCCVSGSDRLTGRWRDGTRLRVWFGPARPWQDLAAPGPELPPGRALYQGLAEAVMREIAILRTGQQTEAARGAA